MAGERALPGLGLTAFWNAGDNTWKPGMDDNIRILSALVQSSVLSRTTSLPASPTDGDIYIVPVGDANAGDIAIRDNGAWVNLTPADGWLCFVQDDNQYVQFDGSVWSPLVIPMKNSTKTADYVLVDADLEGDRFIKMDVAVANTLTINAGLTGSEPVTVVQEGAGQTTIVAGAGVVLKSADAKLKLRAQYSSATIIPDADAADTFFVVGDLTA